MICPECKSEAAAEAVFCRRCDAFLPAPEAGKRAGIASRAAALFIDPFIAFFLWAAGSGAVAAAAGPDAGVAAAFLLPLVYGLWYLSLFIQGQTPGKRLLGLRVVGEQDGALPGFGRMFVREIIGRFASGLVFGLGYLWAIFDRDGQGWHDKIARTVVVRGGGGPAARGGGAPAVRAADGAPARPLEAGKRPAPAKGGPDAAAEAEDRSWDVGA